MSRERDQLGAEAERLVATHLMRLGWQIEARNWRCPVGELDVVAVHGDTLAIVEVRSASTGYLASPALTVTPAKQRRVCRAAEVYLQQRPAGVPSLVRFDVVAVRYERGQGMVDYYENAFTPEWAY